MAGKVLKLALHVHIFHPAGLEDTPEAPLEARDIA